MSKYLSTYLENGHLNGGGFHDLISKTGVGTKCQNAG